MLDHPPQHSNNLNDERDDYELNMVSSRTSPSQREGPGKMEDSQELHLYGQPKKMLV